MAYPRTTLVVLTLLQLCRAEISNKQPEWYSANVINDGFQPKPITEIFTTESSFSSTNPIIVLSKSNEIPDEIALLSTLKPPTRLSSTLEELINTLPTSTLPPSVATSETPSLTPPTTTIAVKVQTKPQEASALAPGVPPAPPEIPVIPLVTAEPPTVQQSQDMQLPPIAQLIPSVGQLDLSVQAPIQPMMVPNQSNSGLPLRSQSSQNQSQQIRLELIPQVQSLPVQSIPNVSEVQQIVTQLPIQSSTPSSQSNYFLIYQQAPQNIQNYPLPQPPRGSSQGSSVPAVTTQPSIPQPMPTVSASSFPSSPPQTAPPTASSTTQMTSPVSSSPQTLSTTNTMSTTRTLPTISPLAVVGVTANYQNTARPLPSTTTPIPRTESPISLLPLRIRVIAPSGSRTSVNINPITTTKKTKTLRTRKPKPKARKNSYDVCIDSCKGRRDPICAAPLSSGLIDPKTLKGFPSICHMACHNSFRKETYEKLVDGRCGKLRTRIRTVDSNTKLKRDELIKSEYTLDNTGPKTIFEFSGSIN